MPNIELDIGRVAGRQNAIRQLLTGISKVTGGPAAERTAIRSGEFVIGAHDGSRITSDYRNWRFSTTVPSYRAMYFERWLELSTTSKVLYLDRAYLSIYRTIRSEATEKEILCLHCDPNEDDTAAHARYKKGPHIHISVADYPFAHSHIALCLLSLSDVLSSVDSLTEAMRTSIQMIREQFLDVLAHHS